MSKVAIVMLLGLLLGGCTALQGMMKGADLLAPAKNGVEAELTVGKKEEAINTEVGNDRSVNTYSAKDFNQEITNISPLVLVLLVLGWLLPSPNEMARGIKNMFLFWRRNDGN